MRFTCASWALAVSGGFFFTGCQAPVRKAPAETRPARPVLAPAFPSRPTTNVDEASEAALRQRARAHAHYGAGVIHELNDDADAAIGEYYQAALQDPGDEPLVLEVSKRLLQKKEPEKALEIVARAAARPEATGLLHARLGMIYAQLGKEEQAIAANRAAIKHSPGLLAGYHNLFLMYLQKRLVKDAVGVLDSAADQSESSVENLLTLAELYTAVGIQFPSEKETVRAKALAVLSRAEEIKGVGPPARLVLAEQFNALGDTASAARLYQGLLKEVPDSPLLRERVHARLSEIYLRARDHAKAAAELEALARENPTNPHIYYFLGSIALEQKDAARAAENFGRAILLKPDLEQAYYDLANALLVQDQPAEALTTLGKARAKFGQNFVLEFLSGLACSRQKEYRQAIRHYTAAELLAAGRDAKRLNEFFYFQFGAAFERAGDFSDAEKYLRKCLQLAPDFAEALNYLGYMWADQGTNLEEASALIEKAVKAEPKNAAYLDSLAWVQFKKGEAGRALETMLKALEHLDEPDPTVFDHLGDIYSALKQSEKALEAWRKSLSLEASEKVKEKIEAIETELEP